MNSREKIIQEITALRRVAVEGPWLLQSDYTPPNKAPGPVLRVLGIVSAPFIYFFDRIIMRDPSQRVVKRFEESAKVHLNLRRENENFRKNITAEG